MKFTVCAIALAGLLAVSCFEVRSAPPPKATEAKPAEAKAAKPATAVKTAKGDAAKTEAAKAEPAKGGTAKSKFDPTAEAEKQLKTMKVKAGDWPQWFGSSYKNNTPPGKNIPTTFEPSTGKNVKWAANLGSQTYGNPSVANGKVYVGSNNGAGYIKRYPAKVDLGVLLCFNEADGKFLWQHSSEKLAQGRVNDWPLQGICCSPFCDGDRVWYVTSRGEVVCLDAEGFHDKENDGPFVDEKKGLKEGAVWEEDKEADVVWKLDMMKTLGVFQHNMCNCSITGEGKYLFVITSNGVDDAHVNIPAPKAPSFLCMERDTGKVVWTDSSPGENVLHGQWSSPTFGEFNGQPQVIFCGGDGWVYAFDPAGDKGKSKLLWKFDTNPKKSIYLLQRATRNHLIGTPVIYDGLVYIGVGEDPEHGEGDGHLWCINPVNKGGDVSPTLVYNKKDPTKVIAHKRLQALVEEDGDFEKDNPNTAAVWHYEGKNPAGEDFSDHMHRTCGTVAIKNNLLFVADFSGLFHCVDAKTGKNYWVHDLLSASWASPLIVENHVYISDEDGDIEIFELSKELKPLVKQPMPTSVYTTPVVANNQLFIADKLTLYCISEGAKSEPPKARSVEAGDSE